MTIALHHAGHETDGADGQGGDQGRRQGGGAHRHDQDEDEGGNNGLKNASPPAHGGHGVEALGVDRAQAGATRGVR